MPFRLDWTTLWGWGCCIGFCVRPLIHCATWPMHQDFRVIRRSDVMKKADRWFGQILISVVNSQWQNVIRLGESYGTNVKIEMKETAKSVSFCQKNLTVSIDSRAVINDTFHNCTWQWSPSSRCCHLYRLRSIKHNIRYTVGYLTHHWDS